MNRLFRFVRTYAIPYVKGCYGRVSGLCVWDLDRSGCILQVHLRNHRFLLPTPVTKQGFVPNMFMIDVLQHPVRGKVCQLEIDEAMATLLALDLKMMIQSCLDREVFQLRDGCMQWLTVC